MLILIRLLLELLHFRVMEHCGRVVVAHILYVLLTSLVKQLSVA